MSARRKNIAEYPELGLPEVRPLWQKSGLFSDHYLEDRFGDEYRAYRAHVRRWL